MKKIVILSIVFQLSLVVVFSQNVGQDGDTLINYTDINGFKQGFWQKKYYSGKIKYEGYFKNDKPIGEFRRYYENGKLKAFLVYNATENKASATLYNKQGGKIACGNYVYSKKDSIWKYFTSDTILILEENYIEGQRVGLIRKYFKNGNVFEEYYVYNGIRDSIWKKYHADGSLMMQCNHINGFRTGGFFIYYSSGNYQIKGQYENDLKQGKWILYNEDGTIEREFMFNDGIAENQEELDEQEKEMFEKFEKEKGGVIDPEDFIENPELFLRKLKQY